VSIYIDGVFTTSTVLAGAPPLETDRVEILRGPQGTLYGRNAIGGTVNIISPRPTDHPYAEVRAIAENFGFTNFQAAVSGPLAEGLAIRASGYKLDQRHGYYNNVNPGQYKVAGRLRPDDEARHEKGKEKAGVAKHELREQSRAERKKKRD